MNTQHIDHCGDHIVVPDEQTQFDQTAVIEMRGQCLPLTVGEAFFRNQCFGRREQRHFAVRPARRRRTLSDAVNHVVRDSVMSPHPQMVIEYVPAIPKPGHAKNDQFGLVPLRLSAWHQSCAEIEPCAKQAAGKADGAEQLRPRGAGQPAEEPPNQPVDEPQLREAARLEARRPGAGGFSVSRFLARPQRCLLRRW